MRSGPDLYAWLASLPVADRDAALERELGLDVPISHAPPGEHLVGHHMIGVAALVRALHEIPVRPSDVVIDLGSGLGKVALLTHLFTGATVRGIEIQPDIVARAPTLPGVTYTCADARTAPIEDATVVVLYCPFSGPALVDVSRRLDELSNVVVCALGIDLRCRRLVPREASDFWTTIWDSGEPRTPAPLSPIAQQLAHERFDHPLAIDPAIAGTSPSRST